jgi:hypothetical protein
MNWILRETAIAVFASVAVVMAGPPTIKIQPNEAAGQDVFVYRLLPTFNFDSGSFGMFIGVGKTNSGAHDTRSFIQFDLSSVAWPAAAVGKAQLGMYVMDGASLFGGAMANPQPGFGVQVVAARITQPWNESTVAWSTQPPAAPSVLGSAYIDHIDQWVEWDVTSETHDWLSGTSNYGLRIEQTNVVFLDGTEAAMFCDSSNGPNKPYLLLTAYPGDFDLDGDVDGADYGVFAGCFNGTGNPINPGCDTADINNDNSVDGADYGIFAGCFNGSGNRPNCAP